jgi:two-component system, chemotaxis family, sensor kinase CheA
VQRLGLLLDWRGTAIPLLCLHDFAGGRQQPEESMNALIVRHGAQHFALAVDEVVGMRNVLIRPLGEALSGLRGFIGGSLMEDGRILLVLDPLDAMRAILGRGFASSAEHFTTTGTAPATGNVPVSA